MAYAADTFSLTWHWRDNGSHSMYNVLHFENNTGGSMTGVEAASIMAQWRAELAATSGRTAAWRAYMNNGGGLNDQVIRDVTGATSFEETDDTIVLGTDTGNPLPPQTSLLVQKRTAAGGRRARGRIYTTCWSEAVNDNGGMPTLAFRQDVEITLETFADWMFTNDTPLVVASQAGTPTNRNITDFVCGTAWRTQRRRAFSN